MAKLARRKDMDRLDAKLDNVVDTITAINLDLDGKRAVDHSHHTALGRIEAVLADHGATLKAMYAELAQGPVGVLSLLSSSKDGKDDLERLSTLLDGVKVALERMGGNTLPSFRAEVQVLRDDMTAFRHEMADYWAVLVDLRDWLDTVSKPAPPKPAKTKRKYTRRKDAVHPEPVEGPSKDTSPKVMDVEPQANEEDNLYKSTDEVVG